MHLSGKTTKRPRSNRGEIAHGAIAAVLATSIIGIIFMAIIGGAATMQAMKSGGAQLVKIAKAEYDRGEADGTHNSGGEKYWKFAGFGSREAWCGCFVGYCASQAGLVAGETMPSGYPLALNWATFYKEHPDKGTVHARGDGYTPQAGDIAVRGNIELGVSNHVGIVEKVDENGVMWTYEGNSGDATAHREWPAGPANSNWDYYVHITAWPNSAVGDIAIPETYEGKRVGYVADYEWDLDSHSFNSGGPEGAVERMYEEAGSVKIDGFNTLNGRYLIACTQKFGSVGDMIDWTFDDGSVLQTIMIDTKDETWAHGTPACEWGHIEGNDVKVLEFCGEVGGSGNAYDRLGKSGTRVTGATNRGSIL